VSGIRRSVTLVKYFIDALAGFDGLIGESRSAEKSKFFILWRWTYAVADIGRDPSISSGIVFRVAASGVTDSGGREFCAGDVTKFGSDAWRLNKQERHQGAEDQLANSFTGCPLAGLGSMRFVGLARVQRPAIRIAQNVGTAHDFHNSARRYFRTSEIDPHTGVDLL
jgi:hypothetical protein